MVRICFIRSYHNNIGQSEVYGISDCNLLYLLLSWKLCKSHNITCQQPLPYQSSPYYNSLYSYSPFSSVIYINMLCQVQPQFQYLMAQLTYIYTLKQPFINNQELNIPHNFKFNYYNYTNYFVKQTLSHTVASYRYFTCTLSHSFYPSISPPTPPPEPIHSLTSEQSGLHRVRQVPEANIQWFRYAILPPLATPVHLVRS